MSEPAAGGRICGRRGVLPLPRRSRWSSGNPGVTRTSKEAEVCLASTPRKARSPVAVSQAHWAWARIVGSGLQGSVPRLGNSPMSRSSCVSGTRGVVLVRHGEAGEVRGSTHLGGGWAATGALASVLTQSLVLALPAPASSGGVGSQRLLEGDRGAGLVGVATQEPTGADPEGGGPSGGGSRDNELPTANAGPEVTGLADNAVTFDGSGSSDPGGRINGYHWCFDDDRCVQWQSTPTARHVLTAAGTYSVRLWVLDNCGAMSEADLISAIIIGTGPCLNDLPPVAVAGDDQEGEVDEELTFDGSASFDADGGIVSHAWSFGHGQTGSGTRLRHASAEPDQTVMFTITDNCGSISEAPRNVLHIQAGVIGRGEQQPPGNAMFAARGVFGRFSRHSARPANSCCGAGSRPTVNDAWVRSQEGSVAWACPPIVGSAARRASRADGAGAACSRTVRMVNVVRSGWAIGAFFLRVLQPVPAVTHRAAASTTYRSCGPTTVQGACSQGKEGN